jgi:di/tricarboxylate transporter
MTWEGWVSLYLMIVAIFLLIVDKWDASLTFFGVTVLLVLCGIITVDEALKGFSNSAVATIAVLFVVALAVEETGLLEMVVSRLMGKPKNTYTALLRFLPVVIVLSAFTNNTPIVLIFIRVLQSWAVRSNLSLSRLLMPLSFASILGGTCTIIGTSTNLVVQGLAGDTVDLGFFEVGILGLPLSVLGVVYMVFFAKFLLPESSTKCDYMPLAACLFVVPEDSAVVGKSVEQVGLLGLPGTIHVVTKREANVTTGNLLVADTSLFSNVPPGDALQAGDLLFFVGMAECVAEIEGLARSDNDRGLKVTVFECFVQKNQGEIAFGEFEQHFECRILAVNRSGQTLLPSACQQVQRGDVVIVEASYAILHHSTAPQFSEISQVKLLKTKVRSKLSLVQPWIILALSVAMIVLAVFFDLLFAFAGVVGIVAVCIRLITWRQALESIQGSLLLLIACSFALAIALERTGVASNIARGLAFIFRPGGAYTQLMGIFLATSLLTNVISNAAAASVMYPIVVSLCKDTGLSLKVRLLSYFFSFC